MAGTPTTDLRQMIAAAKALVFDFDGTLVDSNTIKRQAFDACFIEFPQQMGEIRDYCYRFNHTPRWEKFKHVYTQILKRPYTSEIDQLMHHRYQQATTRQVIDAAEIPGAAEFLRRVRTTHRMALVSSTPDAIIREILTARSWAPLFDDIQGAPVDKADWINAFRARQNYRPDDVLFFGDSIEDQNASVLAQCPFVSVVQPLDPQHRVGTIQNWSELLNP